MKVVLELNDLSDGSVQRKIYRQENGVATPDGSISLGMVVMALYLMDIMCHDDLYLPLARQIKAAYTEVQIRASSAAQSARRMH